MMIEETQEYEENGLIYIKEIHTDSETGEIINCIIKLKAEEEEKLAQNPERELITAEILLSNAEILSKLKEQDETQAQILLNTSGV